MDSVNSVRPVRTVEAASLAALLAEARTRLIETGTRNRLVHTNRKGKRPATLAILHSDVEKLFELLVSRNATLRFRSDPRVNARGGEKDGEAEPALPAPEAVSVEILQTRVGEENLQKTYGPPRPQAAFTSDLTGLRQRIRSRGRAPAKMEFRAPWPS